MSLNKLKKLSSLGLWLSSMLAGGLLLLVTSNSFALDSDQQQPVYMVADSGTYNHSTGVGHYRGHVKVDQGTTHLTADTVITQSNSQNQLQQVTAYGKPAVYRTITDPQKPELVASANTIKFYPQQHWVVLIDHAVVTQGTDSYRGPLIQYNTQQKLVISPPTKGGRTTIIIQPQSLSNNASTKPNSGKNNP